jgi:hypothetical protein
MELKAELYRNNAARWERRAENERGRNARKWQLTVARAYQILATEVENGVQEVTAAQPVFSWSCWFAPNKEQFETAQRYVLDGFRIVAEHWSKINQLKDQGHNSAEAERTVKLFEECLAKLENELKLLQLASGSIPGFMF